MGGLDFRKDIPGQAVSEINKQRNIPSGENIMRKEESKPQRTDPEFVKEMKELAKIRFFKGLEKTLPTFPEMTRLARRTSSWNQVLLDLRNKPRRENV